MTLRVNNEMSVCFIILITIIAKNIYIYNSSMSTCVLEYHQHNNDNLTMMIIIIYYSARASRHPQNVNNARYKK